MPQKDRYCWLNKVSSRIFFSSLYYAGYPGFKIEPFFLTFHFKKIYLELWALIRCMKIAKRKSNLSNDIHPPFMFLFYLSERKKGKKWIWVQFCSEVCTLLILNDRATVETAILSDCLDFLKFFICFRFFFLGVCQVLCKTFRGWKDLSFPFWVLQGNGSQV